VVDSLSTIRRSWNMSRIRSRDTQPELLVRSLLHQLGYRFTVNGPLNRSLPGRPDIVLPKHHRVVFVHGCFWHQHRGCIDCSRPQTNSAYWSDKLQRNVRRDRRNLIALRRLGWEVIIVWECETRDIDTLAARFRRGHLGGKIRKSAQILEKRVFTPSACNSLRATSR
jgi:DNA mismatch endonuclease, patch repair protein